MVWANRRLPRPLEEPLTRKASLLTMRRGTIDSKPDGSLSIVVVSFNTKLLLRRCLQSLQTNPATTGQEVFVIDNASTDGSAEMVRSEFPDTTLVVSETNIGFSRATNMGLERARGAGALLLNSDTEVQPGALDSMITALESDPDAGMAGCRLVDGDGKTQPSAGGLPGLRVQLFSFYELRRLVPYAWLSRLASNKATRKLMSAALAGYSTPLEPSLQPRYVDFLSGACLMIKQAAMEDIGKLDERIFLYLEDADWCRRARERGWKLIYVPAARVKHLGGQSYEATHPGKSYRMSLERCQSLFIYFRKHNGWLGTIALKLIVVPSMIVRLALTRDAETRRLYRTIATYALRA